MKITKLAIALVFFLVCNTLPSRAETATFVVDIHNTWSEETHPGALPEFAHFSLLAGSTHNADGYFWAEDELANPGMVEMAETGFVGILLEQINASIETGETFSVIDQQHWFCPDELEFASCGPTTFTFEADSDFPLFSFATMLGPSPDWFVGLSGFTLRAGDNWINQETLELYPYDGGTRSANVFLLGGDRNDPPEPISLITEESGQLVTPRSLGTITIRRTLACDLDGDFACLASDIDLLSQSIRDESNNFDLNADGQTDSLDRLKWLEMRDAYLGDADLDGDVVFADFLALSENFGNEGGWAQGDFDGSGTVGFSDFLLLSEHFGTSTAAAVQYVPEPTGNALAACLILLLALRQHLIFR